MHKLKEGLDLRFTRELKEETILLLSVIKWIILSVFCGGVVGGITAIFLKLLDKSIEYTSKMSYYFLFAPLAFFISIIIVKKFAPQASGHGTEKAIESIHKNNGKMDPKVVPIKAITTIITIAFGGSAGKEGPCTQIGAGIASFFAKLFRFDEMDFKRFVVCGISAGFAGVFGTPIASAVFTAEVLYIGKFSYIAFLPSLLAAYVSCYVNKFIGTKHFVYEIKFNANDLKMFLAMIAFGIFIGIISILFIKIFELVENFFNKINIKKSYKGFIGGIVLILIVVVSKNHSVIGLGDSAIHGALSGKVMNPLNWILKILTTSLTLGSGASGGMLTPTLFIGAMSGNLWAHIFKMNISLYSAIGMTSFLGACTNTPLAAIIITMELFGVKAGTYASICCIISYYIVGHRSIYPTQVMMQSKSPSILLKNNIEIGEIDKLTFRDKYNILDRFFFK